MQTLRYKIIIILLCTFLSINSIAQENKVLNDIRNLLIDNVVSAWYPKVIDSTYGGYFTNFDYKLTCTPKSAPIY
ncbi:MAG: hypothetical protein OQJ81_02975 [Melioribacteraceae bacterium]|nr:hypothetical protein [Melioribacteraceae bacterium]